MATPTESTAPDDKGAYCPVFQHALEVIGRRWTGSILQVLGADDRRFGEIRSQVPGLSDRLLDTRLTELESEGIVERREVGSEVRYGLTPKGVALRPVFDEVESWCHTHIDEAPSCSPGRRRC